MGFSHGRVQLSAGEEKIIHTHTFDKIGVVSQPVVNVEAIQGGPADVEFNFSDLLHVSEELAPGERRFTGQKFNAAPGKTMQVILHAKNDVVISGFSAQCLFTYEARMLHERD